MSRVKNGPTTRRRRAKILALAKGFRGSRSKNYRAAKETVMRALAYSYRDRRTRKRDFRRLWIARIGIAARNCGTTYGNFMNDMKKAGIELNRKILSELAVNNPVVFQQIIDESRKTS